MHLAWTENADQIHLDQWVDSHEGRKKNSVTTEVVIDIVMYSMPPPTKCGVTHLPRPYKGLSGMKFKAR